MAAKSGFDRAVTRLEAAAATETTLEALEMMAAEVSRRAKLSIGRPLHPAAEAAVAAIEASRRPRLELGVPTAPEHMKPSFGLVRDIAMILGRAVGVDAIGITELHSRLRGPHPNLSAEAITEILQTMERQELVQSVGDSWSLTDKGITEMKGKHFE